MLWNTQHLLAALLILSVVKTLLQTLELLTVSPQTLLISTEEKVSLTQVTEEDLLEILLTSDMY